MRGSLHKAEATGSHSSATLSCLAEVAGLQRVNTLSVPREWPAVTIQDTIRRCPHAAIGPLHVHDETSRNVPDGLFMRDA